MLELLWIALSECYFFLSYMSGRNAFPQKLTPEQERDCLDRMLRGDEDARSTLIEHNLRLVAHVAKKYQSTGMESDDLISIGTVGLIKAVKTFSPVSGTSLATYAARCIEKCYTIEVEQSAIEVAERVSFEAKWRLLARVGVAAIF